MDRDAKFELVARIFYRKSVPNLWFKILCENTSETSSILELGSGSGVGKQNQLYPKAQEIIGIDVDDRVLSNPYLDSSYCGSAYEINKYLNGKKVDIIYSQMVAEHIDDARLFLAAQLQAIKDDGVIIHSTVSKYHWVMLINNLVPKKLKNWLIMTLGSGRQSEDIFPAQYKLNSLRQLEDLSRSHSFSYEVIRQDEPPGYLRRSIILMLIYTAIHKPLQAIFPALRPTFIFLIRKL